MNEDIDENYKDILEENDDTKEELDRDFEPLDEPNKIKNDFNIFQPRDENINANKILMDEFEPREYFSCKISEKKGVRAFQKLYNNGKVKECGRGHEFKPISQFILRRDKLKPYPKSTCKKCDLIIKQIYALSNKYKIIQNIYGGRLNGKCQDCGTGVSMLPALEFHHLDPKLKKKSWHSQMYKNWKKTMKNLEEQKVTILCRNCHFKQRSTIYNKYKDIIQRMEIGDNMVNKEINLNVKRTVSQHDPHLYSEVALHIKKRNVINQLYEGKCVGCKQITTENNLPALNFHHRNKSNLDKSNVWNRIHHLEFKQIKVELKKRDCVSLCGNCHQLIDSHHFMNHHEKIIDPEYSARIKTHYARILENIKNFEIN